MKNRTDVSVIVPVYNVEEYLEACLDSLLRQGDINIEVIMIDDGSTDSSGAIADRYVEKYDNFYCHHIENGGLGHARNYAVPYAQGKYIIFLDSDDIVPDYTYYKMHLLAEKHDAELTICNVARFDSKGFKASPLHKKAFFKYEEETHITHNYCLLNDTTSWNKLIRKDYYERNQFSFPENILYEDIPVTIPMHFLCNKVAVMNEIGYLWRIRDGSNKSITQRTSSMKNLTDRIEILRMLDKFFEENVKDRCLNIEKQYKHLDVDLKIFVNTCASLEEQDAYEVLDIINDYIDEAIEEEAFEKLSLIDKQKYFYVRNRDLEGLVGILEYKGYHSEPISEQDGKLIIDLPEEIFTIPDRDVTEEFRRRQPTITLGRVSVTEDEVRMTGYLYWKRLNMLPGQQNIRVYLSNYKERFEVRTEPYYSEKTTKKIGPTIAPYSKKISSYNYDGVGFVLSVTISDVIEKDIKSGLYHLEVEYSNRFFEGCEVLRGLYNEERKDNLQGALASDGRSNSVRLMITDAHEMNIIVDRESVFLDAVEIENEDIVFSVNKDTEAISAKHCTQGDFINVNLKKIGNCKYSTSIRNLRKGEQYCLAAKTEGKEKAVLVKTNGLSIIHRNPFVILSSGKTKNVRIVTEESCTVIERTETEKDRLIIHAKKIGLAKELQSSLKSIKILTEDKYAEEMLCIGNCLDWEVVNNEINMSFDLDLTKRAIEKRLYSGVRLVIIKYMFEDGSEIQEQIYCDNVRYKAKCKGLIAELFNSKYSRLALKATQVWPKNQKSSGDRNALINKKYPEYLREPIVKNRIIFESIWGEKYSCNPRAIYEYIDANYPEFECIWALNDDRVPIKGKGKRVRRGSLQYYYYLATSKYLVNNVNFPQRFVKRAEQIEIQTMHGTPLKTLGLDVPDEFPTQQSVDMYIKRNSAWDYLVTQGKFVEDKVYQMFRVNPKVLKTGYPRTDNLINTSSKTIESIKSRLGLPRDKKIILYAPTWRIRDRFDMNLELETMRKALSEDYVLLIRMHHFSSKGYEVPEDHKFIFDYNKYSSIEDLYLISDILITDYSSVMFDYTLLDKPMIFFTYDMEDYCDKIRGLYVDFGKEAPGPICMTTEEVIDTIKNIDEEMEKCKKSVDAFKKKFLTYESGNSTEQVVEQAIKTSKARHYIYLAGIKLRKYNPARIIRKAMKKR